MAQGAACEQNLVPIMVPKKRDETFLGYLNGTNGQFYEEHMANDIPVGTIVPGVMIYGQLDDDRGDVKAEANWQDGRWHLELSRSLAAGSPFDISFFNERPIYMWVTSYDATQTRHARHLRPVQLIFHDR
jgi:Ethylbenzene dehydrogenase.